MLEYIYIGILILFSIISKFQNNSKFGEIKKCSLQRIIKICYRINKSRYRSLSRKSETKYFDIAIN